MILSFHKLTKFYPILSFISFGTNALLNYVFIPKYGIIGAAWATVISSILYSLYINYRTWKYIDDKKYNMLIIGLYGFSLMIFIFWVAN